MKSSPFAKLSLEDTRAQAREAGKVNSMYIVVFIYSHTFVQCFGGELPCLLAILLLVHKCAVLYVHVFPTLSEHYELFLLVVFCLSRHIPLHSGSK